MRSMWTAPEHLLLASTSALRAELLTRAGLPVRPVAPVVNEREVQQRLVNQGERPQGVARQLAGAKACSVSDSLPAAYVIGFDQTLEFEGTCLSKPASKEDLLERLTRFSGRQHSLHSGYAIAKGGQVIDQGVATALVTFRSFSTGFAKSYIDMAGPSALGSVGGYQIEGLGVHLFEFVEGDYYTIIGTPIFQLLHALRTLGLIVR